MVLLLIGIEYIGHVEWRTIKPVFDDASPAQLLRFEYYNPVSTQWAGPAWLAVVKITFQAHSPSGRVTLAIYSPIHKITRPRKCCKGLT